MRRPEPRRSLVLAALAALLLAGVSPRAAESPQQQLDAVERGIAESRARQDQANAAAASLAAELADLRRQSVALAAAAQAHERELSRLEARLAELTAAERVKRARLAGAREREAKLLMALARIATVPSGDWLFAPAASPDDAVRGALAAAHTVPPLEREAAALGAELRALAALRQDIAAFEHERLGARDALKAEDGRLAGVIAQKTKLARGEIRTAAVSGARLNRLAATAADLRELIARLEAERRKPPPADESGPFATARGSLRAPVSGTLVRRFGAADELGVTSRGLSYRTRPGAQVVAPFAGEVLFAGPFRGYGQILIIGHRGGFASLLAGLGRIDCVVGQSLVAGEPVGIMPDRADQPRFYLELRHDNQPIDPLPWLATPMEKVNG